MSRKTVSAALFVAAGLVIANVAAWTLPYYIGLAVLAAGCFVDNMKPLKRYFIRFMGYYLGGFIAGHILKAIF